MIDHNADYYSSKEWIDKQAKRLEIDGWECKYCGSRKNLHVHHLNYERFGGNEIVETDLVTVCGACHNGLHSIFVNDKIEKLRSVLYLEDQQIDDEAQSAINARFASWVWQYDIINGGKLNLSDISTLCHLRNEFQDRTSLRPYVNDFHSFIVQYKLKIVDDLFIKRKTINRINALTGVSKRRISERRQQIMTINWESVEESKDFVQVPAGPYVVQITDAEDVPEKQYNMFVFDIIEGEYQGAYDSSPDWAHRFVRSYKETALGMYKAFFMRIEESNPGFKFNGDEHAPGQFVGTQLGIVLREEEYRANDGTVKTRLSVAKVVSADDVRNGTAKPMNKKPLNDGATDSATTINDPYNLPF